MASPAGVGNKDASEGASLESRWKQHLFAFLVFLVTSVWVALTITFSLISSSSTPIRIFAKPGTTILVLNVLSTITLFFLKELVAAACESLRWTLSVRPIGIDVATFLGLGSATNALGVLRLLFSSRGMSHKKWCAQRYDRSITYKFNCRAAHIVIGLLLSVLLFSNINIETTYVRVGPIEKVLSGMAVFNISFVSLLPPNHSMGFMMGFTDLLINPERSKAIPPTNPICQDHGNQCFSYVFPGSLVETDIITENQTLLSGLDLDTRGSTALVVQDAPGYQLEYFPIPSEGQYLFDESNCRLFNGSSQNVVRICLKNINNTLLAGES
jgi:hypothetical protein